MLNSVETFKEKLRATLSEPNSSSDRTRKTGKTEPGSDYGIVKAKSTGNSKGTSTPSSGSQRRARWIRDKIKFNHSVTHHDEDQIQESKDHFDKSDPRFHDHRDSSIPNPKYFDVNETAPSSLEGGPNNIEMHNYK